MLRYLRKKLQNEELLTEKDTTNMFELDRDYRGKVTGIAWFASTDRQLVQRLLWLHGTLIKLKSDEYELNTYLSQYPYTLNEGEEQVDLEFEKRLLRMEH